MNCKFVAARWYNRFDKQQRIGFGGGFGYFSPRIDGDAIEDIAYDYFLLFVYNFFVFLINRSAEIVVYAATEARYIFFSFSKLSEIGVQVQYATRLKSE